MLIMCVHSAILGRANQDSSYFTNDQLLCIEHNPRVLNTVLLYTRYFAISLIENDIIKILQLVAANAT